MQNVPKALESVLDIARWAPSGDNAQPWTFRVINEREIEVTVRRNNPNVYEYRNGEPTLISAGGLLENIKIAARRFGMEARWRYRGSFEGLDHIAVNFSENGAPTRDALFEQITRRSVDRRRYRRHPLAPEQKAELSRSLNPDMAVEWYDSISERRKIARLSAMATNIRLTIPEAFAVHADIVDWEGSNSEHAIPSRALGLDPLTLLLTRWSMANWGRTKLMNALGAPYFASLQMDLLPGLFSGSYFVMRTASLLPNDPSAVVTGTLQVGEAIQRFWLTASKLGLVMQPCVAILAFWTYGEAGRAFSVDERARKGASKLANEAKDLFGSSRDIVFLGRIGYPRTNLDSRSIRLPLDQLIEA